MARVIGTRATAIPEAADERRPVVASGDSFSNEPKIPHTPIERFRANPSEFVRPLDLPGISHLLSNHALSFDPNHLGVIKAKLKELRQCWFESSESDAWKATKVVLKQKLADVNEKTGEYTQTIQACKSNTDPNQVETLHRKVTRQLEPLRKLSSLSEDMTKIKRSLEIELTVLSAKLVPMAHVGRRQQFMNAFDEQAKLMNVYVGEDVNIAREKIDSILHDIRAINMAHMKKRALDPERIPAGFTASVVGGTPIPGRKQPDRPMIVRASKPFIPPEPRQQADVLQDIHSRLAEPVFETMSRQEAEKAIVNLQKLQVEVGTIPVELKEQISQRIRDLNMLATTPGP